MYLLSTEPFKVFDPIHNVYKETSYNQLYDEHIMKENRKIEVGCVWISEDKKVDLTQKYLTKMEINIDGITGSSFEFGCLGSRTLTLGMTYEHEPYRREFLKPYIDLTIQYFLKREDTKPKEEKLRVPLGVFIVDEVKNDYLTKEIVAHDFGYYLDTGDIYKFPNYTQPNSIDAMIDYINTSIDFMDVRMNLGIDEKNEDETYKHKIIDKDKLGITNSEFDNLGENFTLRGFIGYLAGLQGKNAIYDRNGVLRFVSFNKPKVWTYNENYILSTKESDVAVEIDRLNAQYIIKEMEPVTLTINIFDEAGYTENTRLVIKDINTSETKECKFEHDGEFGKATSVKLTLSNKYHIDVYTESGHKGQLASQVVMDNAKTIWIIVGQPDYYSERPLKPGEEVLPELPQMEESSKPTGKWTTKTISIPEMPSFGEYTFLNPLVNTAEKLQSIYDTILGEEGKYSYMPCTTEIKGDPRIDIHDVIELERRKKIKVDSNWTTDRKQIIKVPVMRMKMFLNAGCVLEVESLVKQVQSSSSTLSGSLSSKVDTVTAMAKGMFNDLYGVNATIGNLYAKDAKINRLVADYVKAEQLFAENGVIKEALIGNLDAGTIKGGTIDASEVEVINLNASNINTGVLNTNDLTIAGNVDENGNILSGLEIDGNTILFRDGPDADDVQIQIGLDEEGKYSFYLFGRDEDGKKIVLWDPTGIKSGAIAEGVIRNEMISSDRINADKINIGSVVDGINDDKVNDKTIISNKVSVTEGSSTNTLTETVRSLRSAIKETNTYVDSTGGTITETLRQEFTTGLDGVKSQISATNTRIDTTNNNVESITRQQSSIEQNIDKIELEVYEMDSDGNIVESKIKQNADNILLKVNKNGVSSAINMFTQFENGDNTQSVVKINADKIDVDGVFTVFNALDGTSTTINGNKITTGTITADKLVPDILDNLDKELTQEEVFNALTNNGAQQGIYMEDGNMYMNADYIKTGTIRADMVKVNVDSHSNLLPFSYVTFKSGMNEDAYFTGGVFKDEYGCPTIELYGPKFTEKYCARQLSSIPVSLKAGKSYWFTIDLRASWNYDYRVEDMGNGIEGTSYPMKGSGIAGTASGNNFTLFLANGESDFNNGNSNYYTLLEIEDFDSAIPIEFPEYARGAYMYERTFKKFINRIDCKRDYEGPMWFEMEFNNPVDGLTVYVTRMQLLDAATNTEQDLSSYNYFEEIRQKHIELTDDVFYKGIYSVDGISLTEGNIEGKSEHSRYKFITDYDGYYFGSTTGDRRLQLGNHHNLTRSGYYDENGVAQIGGNCYGFGVGGTLNFNSGSRGIFCGIHEGYKDHFSGENGRADIYTYRPGGADYDDYKKGGHDWALLGEVIEPRGLVRRDESNDITTGSRLKFNENSAYISVSGHAYDYDLLSLFPNTSTLAEGQDVIQSPIIPRLQALEEENEDLKRRIEALEEIIKNMQ